MSAPTPQAEGRARRDETVLAEAERIINGPRRDDYGDVVWSFEAVAAGWSQILRAPVTSEQVALCMVWLKVMREVNAPKRDNLVDIAGYTGLAEKLQQLAVS